MIVAGCIGAIGIPCSRKGSESGEKIAMTASVLTLELGELGLTVFFKFCWLRFFALRESPVFYRTCFVYSSYPC